MATITPRGNETQAMVDILTDDSYADEVSMGKALIKKAYELLLLRTWWCVGVAPGENPERVLAFYGLAGSEGALKAEVNKTLEVGGRAMVLPIFSLDDLAERRRNLELDWGKSDLCGRCGHREASHGFVSFNGKKAKQPPNVPPCSARCGCPAFVTPRDWKEHLAREKELADEQAAIEAAIWEEGFAQPA